jgi:hypothetical protein
MVQSEVQEYGVMCRNAEYSSWDNSGHWNEAEHDAECQMSQFTCPEANNVYHQGFQHAVNNIIWTIKVWNKLSYM